MAIVVMLKTTNYKGVKNQGEQHEVADDIAKRWYDRGIAEYAEAKTPDFESMTAKQLYFYLKDQGVEIDEAQKKDKEYLLTLVEA